MGVTDSTLPLVVASPFIAAISSRCSSSWAGAPRRLPLGSQACSGRWIGPRPPAPWVWLTVVVLTCLVVSGLLLDGLVSAMNEAFSVRDTTRQEGVTSPRPGCARAAPARWSPGTPSAGRAGPSPARVRRAPDIEAIVDRPAKEPIRAYAGLASADDTEDRAALAVDDLERAGGFQRANLLVVTTTGSGWVNPSSADTFEYLTGGDSAIVAMQYSYLPSWLSYLVDQTKAREAGRDLFDAVYDRWSQLPADQRPRAVRLRREPGVVRRRDRVQRRVRPAQPHRRHGVRRAAELQHPVPRVPRPPGRRHPRDRSRSTRTAGRCASRTTRRRRSRRRASRGTAPASSTSCTPSDPIVWWSPQLAASPSRTGSSETARHGRAAGHRLAAVRHVLAGDGRPDVRRRRPRRARPRVQGGVRRRLERGAADRAASPPTSWRRCARRRRPSPNGPRGRRPRRRRARVRSSRRARATGRAGCATEA